MRTEVIDPHDEPVFRRFHEIMWRAETQDGRPWNPMWTHDEMAGIFREPTAERRYLGLAAYDGDRMVGAGFLSLSLLSNLETAWAFVAVEPDCAATGTARSSWTVSWRRPGPTAGVSCWPGPGSASRSGTPRR